MPYVGRDAASFTTVVDVTVSDDLTVTDDASIGGALSAKGGSVFNDDGVDVDFRVESEDLANMLFVDGGNNSVQVGSATPNLKFWHNTTLGPKFMVEQVGAPDGGNYVTMAAVRHDASAEGPQLGFAKSRATAAGGVTVAVAGDALGIITFQGADGTNYIEGSRISSTVESGVSGNDMPANLRFFTNSGTTASAERMRINSTGVSAITSGGGIASTAAQLFVQSNGSNVGTGTHTLYAESSDQVAGHTGYFYSNSTQTGNVCRIYKDGAGDASALFVHTDGLFTVAEFNRQSNDGIIIDLKQAGTSEGTISVSGSTVTYNAFSGSHWSRLSDNSKPDLLRGTVIETIDAMCVWYHLEYTIPQVNYTKDDEDIPSDKKIGDERYGSQPLVVNYEKPDNVSVGDKIDYDHNGTTYEATVTKNGDVKHVQCKVSDTADSTRVYGVFLSWDNDDDSVNDMYVTAVGTNLLRVHKDQTISAGDLLVSNGDGTAKKQDDDIIRSKTIGKALTNIKQETYDDGSYTIPCALYCG